MYTKHTQMKKVFTLCLSAICFLSITSCSKYYISTLSSTNALKDSKTGQFNVENDSVKVTYSFAGLNAPVQVTVKNKLAVPIYVDWSKSALIFEEKATSYVPDKIAFSADLSSSSWRDPILTTTDGQIKGQIGTRTKTSFIPPNSKVETTTIFLKSPAFQALADENFAEMVQVASNQGRVNAYSVDFTRSNSPVVFRSYLTLFTSTDNAIKTFALDNEFFISRSIRTNRSPNELIDYNGNYSDVFYTNKLTPLGEIATGISVLGVESGNPPPAVSNPDKE
jgi:hypothetical protein